jgi:hypothetical protein
MKRSLIRTELSGFSATEWAQIRLAAQHLRRRGADAATLLLPGRPEVFRLDRRGNHFRLRVSDEEEVAETLRAEVRARQKALL